jgi:MFS family permease
MVRLSAAWLGWVVIAFMQQGLFAGGGMYGQAPSYLTERFPTEIRGTATGFCDHVGEIPGAMVPPILTFFVVNWDLGFAIPMLIGTLFGLAISSCRFCSAQRPRGRSWSPNCLWPELSKPCRRRGPSETAHWKRRHELWRQSKR